MSAETGSLRYPKSGLAGLSVSFHLHIRNNRNIHVCGRRKSSTLSFYALIFILLVLICLPVLFLASILASLIERPHNLLDTLPEKH